MNDQEFIELYNRNILIIKKASSKYTSLLSKDDIYSCQLCGLFRAISKYDPSKSKFSTFLFNCVKHECLAEIRKNKSLKILTINNFDNISTKNNNFNRIIDGIDTQHEQILKQRFIYGMTFKEIGKANSYSYETARKRLKLALNTLKNLLE